MSTRVSEAMRRRWAGSRIRGGPMIIREDGLRIADPSRDRRPFCVRLPEAMSRAGEGA